MNPLTLVVLLGTLLTSWASPLAAAAQESGEAVRPQVAELVRSALLDPERPETWEGLARLLPELAITDKADVVTIFEASRLADSMASAPLLPIQLLAQARDQALERRSPTGTEPPPATAAAFSLTGVWSEVKGWSSKLNAMDLLAVSPWAAVMLLLGLGGALRVRRSRAAGNSSRKRGLPGATSEEAKAQRRWTVTTLAESGLPPAEIARRTGMAQDAVHVLLGLRSSPAAPISRGGTGGLPGIPGFGPSLPASRPPSLQEQAAGIATARVQLSQDSRRLKGGRVTYGPGRLA